MPTAAAMSMSGRESKDVAAEIVSGIDVLGLTGPLKVRPHAYEIGPIVAADNGSGRRGGTPNSHGLPGFPAAPAGKAAPAATAPAPPRRARSPRMSARCGCQPAALAGRD